MTFVVGLTGGLSSGKSTVAAFFNELGAPVIDADAIARQCVLKGTPALAKIAAHFTNILTPDGELNRQRLREIIFDNPQEKQWLEALLHPEIFSQIQALLKTISYPYCIVMIPLLTENLEKYKNIINYRLVVDTSEAQQIAWGAKRDNNEEALIKKMIQAQAKREVRLAIADGVLANNGSLEDLKNKVDKYHQLFLSKSAAANKG